MRNSCVNNRLLFISIFCVALSGCGANPVRVEVQKPTDSQLTCPQIAKEMQEAAYYKQAAHEDDKFQWRYLNPISGFASIYKINKAEQSANQRLEYLQSLAQQKQCAKSSSNANNPNMNMATGMRPINNDPYGNYNPSNPTNIPQPNMPPSPYNNYPNQPQTLSPNYPQDMRQQQFEATNTPQPLTPPNNITPPQPFYPNQNDNMPSPNNNANGYMQQPTNMPDAQNYNQFNTPPAQQNYNYPPQMQKPDSAYAPYPDITEGL